MAFRTDPRAQQIHGTNPQFLIDKITRLKIMNDPYTKEKLFALDAETLVDRAFELKYIGGTYGMGITRPTKFICLLLKMLQIQPSQEIVLEFINNEDYRYIRAIGILYFRMTCANSAQLYQILEPLYSDFRRIVVRDESGKMSVLHFDEYIDLLLREDTFCGIQLPRIQRRWVLEEIKQLQPRTSALQDVDDAKSLEWEKQSSHHRSKQSDSSSEDYKTALKSVRQRSRSRDRDEKPDQSSDQYWLDMRAKLGLE